MFFDRNDVFMQFSQRSKLRAMQQDKLYFKEEIEKNQKIMDDLMNNPEKLERFAREKYLMKKDDEDVYVITYNADWSTHFFCFEPSSIILLIDFLFL